MVTIGRWRSLLGVIAISSAALIISAGPDAAASPTADLAIGLTADPAGTFTRTVTWKITVTNHGPNTLEQATISSNPIFGDPPPISVVLPPECTRNFFGIGCVVRSIQPGTRTQLAIKASGTGLGQSVEAPITFRLLSSTPTDPNPSNNSATITCRFGGSFAIRC